MTGSRLRIGTLRLWQDIAAVALLAGLSFLLFRDSLGNGLYIGNPDRLNSNLKILKYYVDGLAQGHLDAWSPFEMLGFDSFALPYTFPSIFTLIAYLSGVSQLYVVAGYEVIVLLALAGLAAYAFLRAEIKLIFPALIGAVMCEFSSLSILKVSQNDLSFAVFVFIPVIMLTIRSISRRTLTQCFFALSLLIFLLLHFTFLQKAAYALILAGSYALYRSFSLRDWRVAAVFGAAAFVGLIGALPRLYGIAVAIKEYSRVVEGINLNDFNDTYRFQAIFPSQLLRWFDVSIFGRFPSEALSTPDNPVNLTEGFLLYTSSFVPWFVIAGLFVYGGRPFRLLHTRRNDASFFVWFLIFTFSVIAVPVVLEAVWLLFLRMDFTHARILIAGLLPLSMVVAALLADMEPQGLATRRSTLAHVAIAIGLAVLLAGGIELIAGAITGSVAIPWIKADVRVLNSALARIASSVVVVIGFIMVALGQHYSARHWTGRFAVLRHPGLSHVLYLTIGLTIGLHTFLSANFDVNGPQTRTPPPFLGGNNHYSTSDNFRPPTPGAIAVLNRRLENDNYRAVLLCDPMIAGGFCAGHIPGFWRLRVVDGYYGLGVPTRLASLPWKAGMSLRTISFTNPGELDWPILGLLNVKYAAKIPESLYRNNSARAGESWKPANPDDVQIIANPMPVTPRYFFARKVSSVANASEAAARLVQNGKVLMDVTETSLVEGASSRDYADGQILSVTGSGDHIRLDLASSDAERFLVANELYFPGWSALVDGKSATVYPTNVVMRGVVVPAGATSVQLIYTPVVRRGMSLVVYGLALALLAAGTVIFSRSRGFAIP